jgi:hypothetical protein
MNEIGVLKRREIEVRILAPLLKNLGDEFGLEKVLEITRKTIVEVARQQGADLADSMGGCSLIHFAASLEAWKLGDAMQMDLLKQDKHEFSFNVTRCRYAEMYKALGIPDLGVILSCSRDAALIEGFNPEIELTRTQTLMEDGEMCDFRYKFDPISK